MDQLLPALVVLGLFGVAGVSRAQSSPPATLHGKSPAWPFGAIVRPVVPRSSPAAENPIDAFLAARWRQDSLRPAGTATPRELARRLHFILTGLPPAPGDLEAFVKECSTAGSPALPLSNGVAGGKLGKRESGRAAIERLVDRLLASPHFGERFARHWMDVVRYADTHGTEHDAWLPHAWRYRDWLIRAFNSDLPYDQFVREHLAGDLLENPRWSRDFAQNESLLATAWWRLVEFNQTPVDVKGEEVIVVDNQIDALSKAFLGLTVSCARCHDHKFDPISQRDFHGLYSILASTRTSMRVLDPPEKLHAADAGLATLKSEARSALAATWKKQVDLWPSAIASALAARSSPTGEPSRGDDTEGTASQRWRAAFAAVESSKSPLAPLLSVLRDEATGMARPGRDLSIAPADAPRSVVFADFTNGSDGGWFATGGFARPATAGDFVVATAGSNFLAAIYPSGRFSHLLSDKHAGTFRSPNFIVTNKFISALATGDNNARLRLVIENFQGDSLLFTQVTPRLTNRAALRWVTLPIRDNWPGRRAYLELVPRDDMPYVGIVKDAAKLAPDGRSAAGIAKVVFHDSARPPEPPAWPPELDAARRSFSTPGPVGGERRGETATPSGNTRPTFASAFTAAARRAVEAWQAGTCDDAQANFLNGLLHLGLLENSAGASLTLRALMAGYRELESSVPIPVRAVAVSDEAPGFDERLFPRGNHHQPAAPEPRHFLSALGAAPYRSAGSGRRELAEDVARSPLAARVMVNRLWHHVFGAGLVRTTDNFGKLGERPSHPELLEWLAAEFLARGGSVKTLLKLMLTSEAFALSCDVPPGAAARDPDNRLLSHANHRRLDAESLRDALLAASGRLDRTVFGPGVPVTVPPGQRDDYTPNDGPLDGLGRRSLYLEMRRNHPSPFLVAFDQPRPASPAGRRETTNLPAQALTLLNDPFVVQQASLFAQRALAHTDDAVSRAGMIYATALGRPATEDELKRSVQFIERQTAAHNGDGAKAWRDLAHAVFNLKEFLWLR